MKWSVNERQKNDQNAKKNGKMSKNVRAKHGLVKDVD